jgi:hypothetical protein
MQFRSSLALQLGFQSSKTAAKQIRSLDVKSTVLQTEAALVMLRERRKKRISDNDEKRRRNFRAAKS